ncbi:MAG: WbqC family protein [Syntrophaceae bacterium]|nr:WbqC family protein [Syntrophaceae bacterium]
MKTHQKKVAIVQSNYIPWKGYFDMIAAVDEFILYDVVQYTKNDWRNRNKLKTPAGLSWLTIPVRHSGRFGQKICDTEVSDPKWSAKHWQTIKTLYAKAPFFNKCGAFLEDLYMQASSMTHLSQINTLFIVKICSQLGIRTKISLAMNYILSGNKNEVLINLLNQCSGNEYISGPSAKVYLDERLFIENGINVQWMDYSGYREYKQLYPPFEHGVSIIDMLLHLGPEGSKKYMKFINQDET